MKLKGVYLRMDEDLLNALKALAARRKEPMAVVVRNLLSRALAEENAVEGKDVITDAVRRAMRDVLKPVEERMAKLASKAARAAATSMYLNTEVIGELGKHNVLQIYEMARKKAVAYLREQDDDL
ncbi:MAG: hypothetical protein L5656_10755 [Thermanaeromonas sp.]|uniref:hypothetical protein n=1 Tax=Thermanaeromonas sp. TaxID=2003697 RepID=UPI00243D5417|nr:hypothetical protein [Thermanaeromonas sp.]MCG0278982.1 hypothetical protein [Thermanaeromonas sp.]